MPSREPHEYRQVTGRAFAIHLRCFGKNIDKMNTFLKVYKKEVEDIFFKLEGVQFDRRLGIKGMAEEILHVEKSSLEGIQAHARELKVCSKYLGLIRKENLVTSRGEDYINTLGSGGNHIGLLQDYAMKIKLLCPSVNTYLYRKGQDQASYANYRIRITPMVLYAIKTGKNYGVYVNTDDIALTSLLFYPPYKQSVVTESFLMSAIDKYFIKKSKHGIDYEQEFSNLFDELLAETGAKFDEDEFKQKLRNSANNAWCFLIFLRDIGLIDVEDTTPTHWSITQQVPETSNTFPTSYQILELTDKGEELLKESFNFTPVWNKDIKDMVMQPGEGKRIIQSITTLQKKQELNQDKMDSDLIDYLKELGVNLVLDNKKGVYVPKTIPLFDPEYDM